MPRTKETLRVIDHHNCIVEELIKEDYDFLVETEDRIYKFDETAAGIKREGYSGGIVALWQKDGKLFTSAYCSLSCYPEVEKLFEEGKFKRITGTPEGHHEYESEADYS